MLKSYRELTVWQKSIDLVAEIYIITSKFPKEEIYGLASQMRRAAISIPSNIAEGSRRKDLPEYLQFLRISDGSSSELETQIIILERIYPTINHSKAEYLLEEVQKMLGALIYKLKSKLSESRSKNTAFKVQ